MMNNECSECDAPCVWCLQCCCLDSRSGVQRAMLSEWYWATSCVVFAVMVVRSDLQKRFKTSMSVQ
jgi:hypothetical protein